MVARLDHSFWIKSLVILLMLLYLITRFPYFYPFPETTGWSTAQVLTLLGMQAISVENLLIVQGLPVMEVSAECSGVVLMIIFMLVIFLIPGIKLSHRMGSVFFIPVLYFGNIIRLTIDTLAGLKFGPEALVFFHDTLGQVFIFFWTIMLYIIWLRLFDNFPREKRTIHPDGYD